MNLSYCVPRQLKLLEILLAKNEWLTGIQLSCMLHITDRTIRNDVGVLNYILEQYHSSILSARGKGYYLQTPDREALFFVLAQNFELNNVSKEACIRKLLLFLLTADDEVELYDLEEQFLLSRTSLEVHLRSIKKILMNFSALKLTRRSGKIGVSGPESSIRFMLSETLKVQYNHELSKFYCDNQYISEEVFLKVYAHVVACVKKYHLFLDENGIVSIALYLAIFYKRIENGRFIEAGAFQATAIEQGKYDNYNIVYSVAEALYQSVAVARLEPAQEKAEIHQIAIQLSFVNLFQTENFSKEELIRTTSPLIIMMVDSLVQVIKKDFHLDLTNDEELYIGLILHIRALVNRTRYFRGERNPILDSIKSQYPFVFELSLHVYEIFNDIIGMKLTEDELSYVTIHIAGAIERLSCEHTQRKIKIAIISHLNASYSHLLVAKLHSVYSAKIQIAGMFPMHQWKEALAVEPSVVLVTSTVSQILIRKAKAELPILKIDPLLSPEDEVALNLLLAKFRKNMFYVQKEEDSIFHRLSEALFFSELECRTAEETINFLCSALEAAKYVPKKFRKLAFEREALASTALANFIAIPHPIKACAHRTAFAAAILKKPILWGKYKVQIIFMIAVKPEEKLIIGDFFNFISYLMDQPKVVQKILNIQKFPDFLSFLQSIKYK